jgi:hypothetical protein
MMVFMGKSETGNGIGGRRGERKAKSNRQAKGQAG